MERTGHPPFDAVIAGFLAEGTFRDRHNHQRPVADLSDPTVAAGECANVAYQFFGFARQRGVNVVVRDTTVNDIGYADRPLRGVSLHTVCGFSTGKRDLPLLVDFTAAQYGYPEFPLVQAYLDGSWQREFSVSEVLKPSNQRRRLARPQAVLL